MESLLNGNTDRNNIINRKEWDGLIRLSRELLYIY